MARVTVESHSSSRRVELPEGAARRACEHRGSVRFTAGGGRFRAVPLPKDFLLRLLAERGQPVYMLWIPIQYSLPGNKQADAAEREASVLPPVQKTPRLMPGLPRKPSSHVYLFERKV